jgi:hypothetical protein
LEDIGGWRGSDEALGLGIVSLQIGFDCDLEFGEAAKRRRGSRRRWRLSQAVTLLPVTAGSSLQPKSAFWRFRPLTGLILKDGKGSNSVDRLLTAK